MSDTMTNSEADAVTNSEADAVTNSEADAVTNSEADAVTNSEADAVTNSEADAVTSDANEQTDKSNHETDDTYADFAMPEGVEIDKGLLSSATPILKELGATQEQAQKLADAVAKQVQASSEDQLNAYNQLMDDWKEQSKNDKEFGGDKFEENIEIAREAIKKFGTPGFKQLLEEHGVGNHPEVIRFMINVGKLTVEDIPDGSTTSNTSNSIPSIKNPGDDVSGFLYKK